MDKSDPERRKRLEENLAKILKVLKEHYQPEQVMVFGSLAAGTVTSTSDLDILIVKKTSKNFFDRLREVVSLCDYNVGVDFLVYTPQELAEESKSNLFLKNEILTKGKVVYRAAA
jgi:predicted nucleotidyltransferase